MRSHDMNRHNSNAKYRSRFVDLIEGFIYPFSNLVRRVIKFMRRDGLLILFAFVPATVIAALPYISKEHGRSLWLLSLTVGILAILALICIYKIVGGIDSDDGRKRKGDNDARDQKLVNQLNQAADERDKKLIKEVSQAISQAVESSMEKAIQKQTEGDE